MLWRWVVEPIKVLGGDAGLAPQDLATHLADEPLLACRGEVREGIDVSPRLRMVVWQVGYPPHGLDIGGQLIPEHVDRRRPFVVVSSFRGHCGVHGNPCC